MTRKPLSTKLHDLESTASYVSRVAALYGAPDVVTFSSWFGAKFKDLCDGSMRDVEKMATAVRHDPKILIDRIVTGKSTVRHFWGMTLPRTYVRQYVDRICPGCVNDDIENGAGQMDLRSFGRMTWMLNHVLVCPRHKRPLVKLPPIPWELASDFRLRLSRARENATEIFEDVEPVEPSAIDTYVVGRLESIEKPSSWLDELRLPAVLRLCDAAGQEDRRLSVWREGERRAHDKVNDGFVRIAGSEEDFKDKLREVVAANYPRRGFAVSRAFGEIATELGDELLSDEYVKVKAIMRDVAIEMLPLGPEDDMFGPVLARKLHTVRTGAREYEIPASLLRKALKIDWASDHMKNQMPMIFEKATIDDAYRALVENEPSVVVAGKARFAKMLDRECRGSRDNGLDGAASKAPNQVARILLTSMDVVWSLADDGHLPVFQDLSVRHQSWRISNRDIADFTKRYMPRIELKKLLHEKRKSGFNREEPNFQPAISRADVGEDFFDRSRICRSFR